jgi:hypothetical protein
VCTWAQFARCRFEVGPVSNVVPALYDRIQSEAAYPLVKKAIAHEVLADGQKVVFENVWFRL